MKNKNQSKDKKILVCQKCLKYGHFTYECQNDPVYSFRPSKATIAKSNMSEDYYPIKSTKNDDDSFSSSSESVTSISNISSASSDSSLSEDHIEIRKKLMEKIESLKNKKQIISKIELKNNEKNVRSRSSTISRKKR